VKTQIIQLEDHDDTVSVRDKMDWSQTPRVLLEWPEDGKILRKRLDLILLERYCSTNGSQLALLTRDRKVIHQAEEAGIPVFQSRSEAQIQPWGKSFREFKRQEIIQQSQQPREFSGFEKDLPAETKNLPTWASIVVFTLAVAGVLAIGATLLPSATVRLPSENQYQEITIPIQAISDQSSVQISGIIPAQELTITVDGQSSVQATGTIEIPLEYASGEVVFSNLSDKSINIPTDTVLSADNEESTLYITIEPGRTPDGTGSQIVIPIQALKPGIQGNLPANMITRINQEVGADLSVINPVPTTGGTNISVPAPNESDHQRAKTDLMLSLTEMAQDEALGILEPDDILISKKPEVVEILDITADPELGSAGNELVLTSSIQFRIIYTSADDLDKLAEQTINALFSGGAFSPDFDTVRLTQITDPLLGFDQVARWKMLVAWNESRVFDQEKVIRNVLGKKPAEAEEILQDSFELTNLPEIEINPSWWFRIPVLPFRIRVIGEIE